MSRAKALAAALFAVVASSGCWEQVDKHWFTQMKNGPAVQTYAKAPMVPPDGTIPADTAAQAEICFANIAALLREAGMAPADLVRLTTYLIDPNDRAGYMAARDRFVGSPPPASTLLIISALADPRYRIEVEAVAART